MLGLDQRKRWISAWMVPSRLAPAVVLGAGGTSAESCTLPIESVTIDLMHENHRA